MPFVGTVNYRLAGNLFSNSYYFDGELADSVDKFAAVITAQAELQTNDVEYINALLTDLETPYTTHPVAEIPTNGSQDGGVTGPAITFLEFVFYPTSGRGKTTHRVRGYAINYLTDLGVFNTASHGSGDVDAGTVPGSSDIRYTDYLSTVATSSVDRSLRPLNYSERISIGSKRATRRL